MRLKKIFLMTVFLTGFFAGGSFHALAADKIRIVATTTTFASIAKAVAGERAEIYAVASPKRDIHFISPTPKDVLKVKKADVFINGGLDLETWRGPLLNAAGRPELMWPSGERQIDVSKGISLLEIPSNVSREQGDIHAFGNPHYWSDPENGKIIARNIAEGLSKLYPENAAAFQANLKAWSEDVERHSAEWRAMLQPYQGRSVVSYHRSLIYFLRYFGLKTAGELESKPGIPPSPRHLADLEKVMRQENVRVILQESYYEKKTARKVAEAAGAAVAEFAQSVGEVEEAPDYIAMMDFDVHAAAEAFQKTEGGKPA